MLVTNGFPSPRDAAELFHTVGDPEVMKYWLGGADPAPLQTEQRIEAFDRHWTTHGFGDYAVVEKATGAIIGFAGLHTIANMPDVNLGYAFRKNHWRQGYGTEVCRALLHHGFHTLNFPEIIAVIWPENAASIALAVKLGMKFRDRILWSGSPRVVYAIARQGFLVPDTLPFPEP
jgi:RimJ/RimL family protein N-acetyltransferase